MTTNVLLDTKPCW